MSASVLSLSVNFRYFGSKNTLKQLTHLHWFLKYVQIYRETNLCFVLFAKFDFYLPNAPTVYKMWLVIFSMFVIVNKSHKKTITNNVLSQNWLPYPVFRNIPFIFFHIENSF